MPQQYIPINVRQVGSALFNWQFLPAFLGMVAISKAVFEPKAEAPAEARVREPEKPDASAEAGWARRLGDAYLARLTQAWATADWGQIELLGRELKACWARGGQVFICGNGGSAANAVHMANDLLYGIDKPEGLGMRAISLPANTSILTCLGNDTSYAEVFSRQLRVQASPGDLLLVLSGSGNSANIVEALHEAKRKGLRSFAILGYSGGAARDLADHVIHFSADDMQVSEDLQMMVVHFLSQWLLGCRNEARRDCQAGTSS